MQPAILSALGETSVLTAREIADAVGRFGYSVGEAGPGRVLNRVHVALRKLRDQGQVERIGHGQGYRLKETS